MRIPSTLEEARQLPYPVKECRLLPNEVTYECEWCGTIWRASAAHIAHPTCWQYEIEQSHKDKAAELVFSTEGDELSIDEAVRIAELWGAGKMIGGDVDAVIAALLKEVKRLRGEE